MKVHAQGVAEGVPPPTVARYVRETHSLLALKYADPNRTILNKKERMFLFVIGVCVSFIVSMLVSLAFQADAKQCAAVTGCWNGCRSHVFHGCAGLGTLSVDHRQGYEWYHFMNSSSSEFEKCANLEFDGKIVCMPACKPLPDSTYHPDERPECRHQASLRGSQMCLVPAEDTGCEDRFKLTILAVLIGLLIQTIIFGPFLWMMTKILESTHNSSGGCGLCLKRTFGYPVIIVLAMVIVLISYALARNGGGSARVAMTAFAPSFFLSLCVEVLRLALWYCGWARKKEWAHYNTQLRYVQTYDVQAQGATTTAWGAP